MAALTPREQDKLDRDTIAKTRIWLRRLHLDGFEMGLNAIQVDGVSDLAMRFEELSERLLPGTKPVGAVSVMQLQSLMEESRR